MAKPVMAFAATRDDWKFRVYTLLDAAFEHALKMADRAGVTENGPIVDVSASN